MTLVDGRYHRDVTGLPAVPAGGVYRLRWSRHAGDRWDGYGLGRRPVGLRLQPEQVFEVTVRGGRVAKFAARVPLGDGIHDAILALAVLPDGGHLVTTAWYNRVTDTHRTLDRGLYGPGK